MSLTGRQIFFLFFVKQWNKYAGSIKTFNSKLLKIYYDGNKRINKSLDIVKLTKDIKYLKLLTMVKCKPDIKTKFEIHHCGKNIIDLKDEDEFVIEKPNKFSNGNTVKLDIMEK